MISQIINARQIKNSLKVQKAAFADMKRTLDLQNEGIKFHKETNETLASILKELMKRKELSVK